MLRVALLQFDAREGHRLENRARVEAAAADAAAEGAELLVLPELWACGYDLRAARAEGYWAQEIEATEALSATHDLAIVGSHLEESPGDLPSNCAIAVENGETLARYRKVHRFGPLGEGEHVRAGDALPRPFSLAGTTTALAICYDLRFPELFRPAASAGVDLWVIPAQWPASRIGQWRALLVARAVESQSFVIGVNRLGDFGRTRFGGHSLIVSPTGEIVLDAGETEGLHLGEFDPGDAARWREEFPVLRDRRTDLY